MQTNQHLNQNHDLSQWKNVQQLFESEEYFVMHRKTANGIDRMILLKFFVHDLIFI